MLRFLTTLNPDAPVLDLPALTKNGAAVRLICCAVAPGTTMSSISTEIMGVRYFSLYGADTGEFARVADAADGRPPAQVVAGDVDGGRQKGPTWSSADRRAKATRLGLPSGLAGRRVRARWRAGRSGQAASSIRAGGTWTARGGRISGWFRWTNQDHRADVRHSNRAGGVDRA